MPTTKLLTLSGTLDHPVQMSDYLLASYFKTLRSQSYLYARGGVVHSLVGDLATSQNNPRLLEEQVATSLTSLFRPYFDEVNVNVTVTEPEETPNMLVLQMAIAVTDGGLTHNVTYQLMTSNSTVRNITKLNNAAAYV